ncbi:MAG: endolytic transglycosylase MltG [Marinilabiliaceae bacterium]
MAIKKSVSVMRPMRAIIGLVVVFLLVIGVALFCFRRYWLSPVLDLKGQQKEHLYIPTGSTLDDVTNLLNLKGWLADEDAFSLMASLMSYGPDVRPGRYALQADMSARTLVAMLRSGNQDPVNVTFNGVRNLNKLAGMLTRNLETDSASLVALMADTAFVTRCGFTQPTLPALFLPDTYQVWWNIDPEDLMLRLRKEYDKFWTKERLQKADSLKLSPVEVATLASIVEEESNDLEDQKIIAGLYLNRLRIGMPMQACPTLKFAMGNFAVKRIVNADMEIDSPYNTYKHVGLPPGPIRVASKRGIDAVLNYTPNDYLFMCARPDGSGKHDFAKTLAQHQRNANTYHKALNKRKIYR